MARTNGKSEVEPQELDAEHELPAGEETEEQSRESQSSAPVSERVGRSGELERLRAERDTLVDRLARSQAEFDNARKRAAREQQEFREYALADAVKTLLPVLDSFERALESGTNDTTEFRSGVGLIYKQLENALAKLGLQAIPSTGEPFDPRLHQAIEMVETSDVEDHHVIEELQRGYKLKDRLLRPSMVRVARNPKQ